MDRTAGPSGERRRPAARRRHLTVRGRILATVLVLTLLTLVVAGGTAYVLQRNRVDARVNASLQRTAEEFTTFAANALDPETSEPFAAPYPLLYQGMQREVPADNEGMVGFVEGRLELVQPAGADLAADQELIDHLTQAVQEGEGVISSVSTSTAQYRYALVPVTVSGTDGAGGSTGALVVAFDRTAERREVDDTFRTYALVAAGSLALLAAVAWVVAGRLLRPVRELRRTAELISDSDLSRRIEVHGTDDLSDLARTVNAMLARLEESFTSQRQLLDDAGHELRTPITIVRGHLELMDADDPLDAAETRELALRELDRMHRLADDLLVLARAERPDFLRPAPVDLGLLTDNMLDQARALGDRRWEVEARTERVVTVDAQRLTQAWLQLAANAVAFSAPGSRITLGSAVEHGRAQVWVRDEGAGIAPADQRRIFERFTRAAGHRAEKGAGLGLAIVNAIVTGHGGHVRVESEVGVGSLFVIDLPADG